MCHITVLMICREESMNMIMAVVTGDRVNIFIIRSIPRLVISRNPLSTIIMSSVIMSASQHLLTFSRRVPPIWRSNFRGRNHV